ncbi:unnamed protein product, partial [Allacma fusca]
MNAKIILTGALLLGQSIFWGEAAKIFFMIPVTTISEKNVYIPLIDALAERGHEVVVASITKSKYKSKNIREFVPCRYDQFVGDGFADPIESRKQVGRYTSLALTEYGFITNACEIVYKNPEFQKVITEKFDLVIKNAWCGHCFNGVLYKLQAPFINFNTMIPYNEVNEQTGARIPASFVPFAMGPARSIGKMSLFARLENVLLDIHWTLFNKYIYYPAMDQISRKYLGPDIPSSEEINKNLSLVLSNSHFVINAPVPVLPDVVEVAGMHCLPPKPVPKDLDEFLSGDKDGFIYFSMGSMVNSKLFSPSVKKMFLSVFSKLKQRVLWKFEADLTDLPPNVKIGKWLPQQDILGHPNIRLFITHGGALSTQEAIYNGVPLVVMPVFADQDNNARQAAEKGLAIMLEVTELTEEILLSAINKVLNDASYAKTAKDLS